MHLPQTITICPYVILILSVVPNTKGCVQETSWCPVSMSYEVPKMHISSIASMIKLLKLKNIVTSQKSANHAIIGLGISCTLCSEPRHFRKFMFCRVRNGTRICFISPLPLATGKSQNFIVNAVHLCDIRDQNFDR